MPEKPTYDQLAARFAPTGSGTSDRARLIRNAALEFAVILRNLTRASPELERALFRIDAAMLFALTAPSE